jgi:hypothetical protein
MTPADSPQSVLVFAQEWPKFQRNVLRGTFPTPPIRIMPQKRFKRMRSIRREP